MNLVGMRFPSDHGELVVVGPASWSDAYMLCEGAGGFKTARPISLLLIYRSAGWTR